MNDEFATQDWVGDYAVAKTAYAGFSQANDSHTETGTDIPLGANLNLAEHPGEELGILQLRINALEAYCNNLAGLCNTLIDVLQAVGLAN